MRTVTFTFRPEVSAERQDAVLREVARWDSVRKAAALKPDARTPEVRRMCYAQLDDTADAETIADRLRREPEIESASVPPARRLV